MLRLVFDTAALRSRKNPDRQLVIPLLRLHTIAEFPQCLEQRSLRTLVHSPSANAARINARFVMLVEPGTVISARTGLSSGTISIKSGNDILSCRAKAAKYSKEKAFVPFASFARPKFHSEEGDAQQAHQ